MRNVYTVSGMTCDHCVAAVSAEVSKLPGVRDVEVDLSSGRVVVESEGPVATDAVRVAVDEAGYELTDTHA